MEKKIKKKLVLSNTKYVPNVNRLISTNNFLDFLIEEQKSNSLLFKFKNNGPSKNPHPKSKSVHSASIKITYKLKTKTQGLKWISAPIIPLKSGINNTLRTLVWYVL